MQFSGIDKRRFDIWRYHDLYAAEKIAAQYWISDGRSEFTPLEKRSDMLWIKREDRHPLGSHKGRSLAYQFSALTQAGQSKFVLSSSGNAAIAFLSLTPTEQSFAIVSPHIDKNKWSYLQKLASPGKVIVSPVAKQLVQAMVRQKGYIDLRPSQSDAAIIGLSSLGFELFEQMPDLSDQYAIISVTTSGGNVLGMSQAFDTLLGLRLIPSLPRLCPVLLSDYKLGFLSDKRKVELEKAVEKSGGKVLSIAPVLNGKEATSFEGNTALAAYLEHRESMGKTIIVFTGKIWPEGETMGVTKTYTSLQEIAHDFAI